jgi:hypothetical protein
MVLLVLTTTQLGPLMLLVGASANCEPEMCVFAITTHVTVVIDPHSGHSEAVSIAPLFRQNPAIETTVAFLTYRKASRTKTVCEPSRTKTFCQRRAKTSRRGSLATVLPSQNGCALLPNLPWTRRLCLNANRVLARNYSARHHDSGTVLNDPYYYSEKNTSPSGS